MLKRVKYVIKETNIRLFGKNFMRRSAGFISGVISIERHKSGNPHSHSLLRFPGFDESNFDRKGFEDFARSTGGFCRVDIPRDQSHVIAYCTKYITKGGEVFLTENFRPVTPQRSLLDGQSLLISQRVGLVQELNQ